MKKILSLVLSLCLLAMLLPAAVAEDVTPMKFIQVSGKEAGYDAATARWNELHPEAPVTVDYYSSVYEVIEASLGIKSPEYDILAIDSPKVGDYGLKGFTADLDSYVGNTIDTSVYLEKTLNYCYYDGHLTALPITAGISFLYYNKTLIEQAGVELREITPENRLTFEEMEEISLKVLDAVDPNRDQGYSGIAFSQANLIYQMLQLPTSMGEKGLVDDQDLSSTLHTDGWRNAALYYQQLINEGVTDPSLDNALNFEKFMSGKCVFMLGTISFLSMVKRVQDSEIVITYNPVFKDYNIPAAPTGSWCVGVSAFSKNKDKAAEYVQFICGGEGHDIYIKTTNGFSAVKADADALLNDENAAYEMKIGTYEVANAAVPRPVTPYYTTYETVMNEFWRNVASGADVDEAIETAVEAYSIYMQ